MNKVIVILICFVLLSGYVKANPISTLNSLDTYSYPLKYALAKDSLVAVKEKDGLYTVYPKYTYHVLLKFVWKIHPALCIKMKDMNYGSLKNPFNKNLSIVPKLKEGAKVLKKDKIVGSNVIVFKNLAHLERELDEKTFKFFEDVRFKGYTLRVRTKYYLEEDLDFLLNKHVKFRALKAVNRFRYQVFHYHIPIIGDKIKNLF